MHITPAMLVINENLYCNFLGKVMVFDSIELQTQTTLKQLIF